MLSTAVVAAQGMEFPHPLELPHPRLRDNVLRQGLVLGARRLRMFPAVSCNLCANCMAWLGASSCITVFSKWKSSSLCNGPSLAIASCQMCSAIVNELVHTRARLMEGRLESRPRSPLVGDLVRARHSPSLRCNFSSAKNCSSENASS